MRRELTILARDPDLVVRGVLPYRSAEITLRWLYPGSWTLELPATPRVLAAAQPGWGIIAHLDGVQILSGSIEDIEQEQTTDGGTVVLSGADDLAIVAGELAYPDPTRGATSQTTVTHDARSGAMETVVKGYVAANVGVGRHADRRDPAAPAVREVVVAPDLGRGAAVSYQARFDPLMDIVRAVAPTGGLGVTCGQQGQQLVFDAVEPRDLSAVARFSFQSRNLSSARWSVGMPEATHVVVAGGDEGTARVFRQRADSVTAQAWRLAYRVFRDQRHTSDTAELDQAGDEVLADATRSGIVEARLVDTARLRFGVDYGLGDRVTVAPADDIEFTDLVTTAVVRADASSGEVTVVPSVGWADGPFDTRQDRQVWELARRISALERSQ